MIEWSEWVNREDCAKRAEKVELSWSGVEWSGVDSVSS